MGNGDIVSPLSKEGVKIFGSVIFTSIQAVGQRLAQQRRGFFKIRYY